MKRAIAVLSPTLIVLFAVAAHAEVFRGTLVQLADDKGSIEVQVGNEKLLFNISEKTVLASMAPKAATPVVDDLKPGCKVIIFARDHQATRVTIRTFLNLPWKLPADWSLDRAYDYGEDDFIAYFHKTNGMNEVTSAIVVLKGKNVFEEVRAIDNLQNLKARSKGAALSDARDLATLEVKDFVSSPRVTGANVPLTYVVGKGEFLHLPWGQRFPTYARDGGEFVVGAVALNYGNDATQWTRLEDTAEADLDAVLSQVQWVRTWTDLSGTHRLLALLLELNDGTATLLKATGDTVKIPVYQLSLSDQEILVGWGREPAK